jgi:nicotinamidase-related amidase
VPLAAAGLALLAALAAAALGLGAFMAWAMFLPTRGRPIRREARPRRAVLVLDLQEGHAGAGARRPVTHLPMTGLFGAVNRLVAWAEASGVEVGYVTQVFGAAWLVRLHGGRRVPRVVVDRRVRLVNANVFEKHRTDAFSSRSLEAWLEERGVGEVILAGVDAAYCVTMTARGALHRGYRVTVASDAVASRRPLAPVLGRLAARGVRVMGSAEIAGAPPG